jgi:hypothetical protein
MNRSPEITARISMSRTLANDKKRKTTQSPAAEQVACRTNLACEESLDEEFDYSSGGDTILRRLRMNTKKKNLK